MTPFAFALQLTRDLWLAGYDWPTLTNCAMMREHMFHRAIAPLTQGEIICLANEVRVLDAHTNLVRFSL